MTLRERMMQEDMHAVVQACVDEHQCPFYGFTFQDDCFSFEYKGLFTKNSYRINMCADYPVGTIKAVQSNKTGPTFNTELVNERVPVIFNEISCKIYRNMKVLLPEVEPDSEDEDQQEAGAGEVQTVDRGPLSSDEDEDEEQYDYDYYNDLENDIPPSEMHPLLSADIESVRHKYGDTAITFRNFEAIGDIDIELHIPVHDFDVEMAKAWKIQKDEAIIVRLHMNLAGYLDALEPKVEVLQLSNKEKFGIGSQMRNILQSFLVDRWDRFTNASVERSAGSHRKKYQHKQSSQAHGDGGGADDPAEGGAGASGGGGGGVRDEDVATILSMGFSSTLMVRNALVIAHGHVEDALTLLIQHPDQCKGPAAMAASKLPDIDLTSRSTQGPRRLTGRSKQPESSFAPVTLAPPRTGQDVKLMPSLDTGFLSMVYEYCRQRIYTLNEFCVVCDEPHVFQNGTTMLKPAVCGRDLCVFSFQTLGVMSEAAEEIATGPEVVDLLIAMGKAACKSARKATIFDPFPTVVDPIMPQHLVFSPKNPDYQRVEKALDALNMQNMNRYHGGELKKMVDSVDHLAFPLLQWLIVSNRSHIVKLPKDKQLPFMQTDHQFLLMSSPPAKEAAFREHKSKHGSTFAFHGSHIENWHSILRAGLLNASGTKHQVNGAAYGKGIYLSPNASTSFSYSGMQAKPRAGSSVSKRFLSSSNLTCIALCEVVTSQELKKNNSIWVMPDPNKVCTRFFFVYEDGKTSDPKVDTQNHMYSSSILKAVNYQYN